MASQPTAILPIEKLSHIEALRTLNALSINHLMDILDIEISRHEKIELLMSNLLWMSDGDASYTQLYAASRQLLEALEGVCVTVDTLSTLLGVDSDETVVTVERFSNRALKYSFKMTSSPDDQNSVIAHTGHPERI